MVDPGSTWGGCLFCFTGVVGASRGLKLAMVAAGCLLSAALVLWIFAGSIDTSVTTSDQNLVQSWAGVLCFVGVALVVAALIGVMLPRAAREVLQGIRSSKTRD
jgi:formate hydrogenlyase subunit 4